MIRVIMFHSVGLDSTAWGKNLLSVPFAHMESFIRYLSMKPYDTPFLDEWYRSQSRPAEVKAKQVFLTFDDGYLDNWVYLFPLLEKYAVRATMFINPEFVDFQEIPRPNLKDVWQSKLKMEDLQVLGNLNWGEIRMMQSSGFVDIQSHSMSHNWYFTSENIIGFYSRQTKDPHWLAWLEKPERKPFWMVEDQRGFVRPGTPIFENGRSLGIRRYFPDKRLIDYAVELHCQHPGIEFAEAKRLCVRFQTESGTCGRMETDSEMIDRLRYELIESKRIIESKLSKPVDFLCWPGGAFNEFSLQIARRAGYRAYTLPSRLKKAVRPGDAVDHWIPRSGLGAIYGVHGGQMFDPKPTALVGHFRARQGHIGYKIGIRIKKYFMACKKRLPESGV
jgi:peptidoglycan/xylan/chitin deacetylase (PgdA/CDA1 family)